MIWSDPFGIFAGSGAPKTAGRWRRGLCRCLATGLLLCGAVPVEAQEQPVDVELAFVVDASGSIDEAETSLQRRGYRDALTNRRVLEAITGGLHGAIAVAYIEFAADGCERMAVPWTRVAGKKDAAAFGDKILAQPFMDCQGGNAVGDALYYAAASIESNRFKGTRRVIDISGDGPNTIGRPVRLVRDAIVARRIVINALAIERPLMPELPEYFREAVTGGPASFVLKAENRTAFAAAILKKMILEIVGKPAGPDIAAR